MTAEELLAWVKKHPADLTSEELLAWVKKHPVASSLIGALFLVLISRFI